MKKLLIISYLFASTILLMSFNKIVKHCPISYSAVGLNDSITIQKMQPTVLNFESIEFDSSGTNFTRLERTIDLVTENETQIPVIIKPIDSTQIQMMLDLAYGLGLIFNNGNNFINGVPNTVLHGLGGTLIGLIIMLIRQRKLKKKHKQHIAKLSE